MRTNVSTKIRLSSVQTMKESAIGTSKSRAGCNNRPICGHVPQFDSSMDSSPVYADKPACWNLQHNTALNPWNAPAKTPLRIMKIDVIAIWCNHYIKVFLFSFPIFFFWQTRLLEGAFIHLYTTTYSSGCGCGSGPLSTTATDNFPFTYNYSCTWSMLYGFSFDLNACRPSYWCNLWSGDKWYMDYREKVSKTKCLLQILLHAFDLEVESLPVPHSNYIQNKTKKSNLQTLLQLIPTTCCQVVGQDSIVVIVVAIMHLLIPHYPSEIEPKKANYNNQPLKQWLCVNTPWALS